jgi:hypothetical protein
MALAVPTIWKSDEALERLLVPRGFALGYERSFVGEALNVAARAFYITLAGSSCIPILTGLGEPKFAYV